MLIPKYSIEFNNTCIAYVSKTSSSDISNSLFSQMRDYDLMIESENNHYLDNNLDKVSSEV